MRISSNQYDQPQTQTTHGQACPFPSLADVLSDDDSHYIGPNTDLHCVPRIAASTPSPGRPPKRRGVFRVRPRDPNLRRHHHPK
ncbi:hypothetical protein PISMIDRAFT_498745 [Pisolithus microcarpus 441]|uniref:Uncharacterized protein n=1 Tax=Pisolithus microcarpus 441 TaxID=765257 RepID=A0A0C9Z0K4_9AGAM|nr:hypothetical protein PISMIDRAFT_498745 [Pisolithus microcarpus 441]